MPSLAELTDQYPQQDNTLPVEQPYRGGNLGPLQPATSAPIGNTTAIVPDSNTVVQAEPITGSHIINKLLGLNGEERYQLWPEKVVRDALSAPHDIIQTNPYPEGSEEASWFEDQRQKAMVPAALNMSALAGTGGLAGIGEEVGTNAALGAGPFLRPALKVGDKIYKAPIKEADNPLGFGAEHSDALPAHLAEDFYKKAMSGEDINHYNFGFVNHKGQFLDRTKALDYGINEGLVDPSAGKYGVLTSTMLADSSKPGTAIEAMAKTQPFYSALEHNVNAIGQSKMTGDQWLGTLANKPGVKPEELDWTGTKEFLQSKGKEPVTKAELQEHLQNNKVELKEVDKGVKDPAAVSAFENYNKELATKYDIPEGQNVSMYANLKNIPKDEINKYRELQEAAVGNKSDTKYHSYQLPGGENYREKLLTLPDKSPKLELDKVSQMVHQKNYEELTKSQQENIERLAMVGDRARDTTYKSSHWDEPNILAHVRMNDRIIDGKKSLHLEEIQSDWHQQGRDKGYQTPVNTKEWTAEPIGNSGKNWRIKKPDGDEIISYGETAKDAIENAATLKTGVPNAPFKKSWHELALKRMIREAAEKGYDRLSWTPGEAQAARYDLSKSVDKLQYNPDTHILLGHKGNSLVVNQKVPVDKLADFVGKEAADKIINKPTAKIESPNNKGTFNHYLEGQDLKIGGEGMKGFYDQIIPKALEKISGEKVKSGTLPLSPAGKSYESILKDLGYTKDEWNAMTKEQRAAAMDKSKVGQPIHYIDIPQSLKDKALSKGFPLFSSTHIFTPVSHNPFEDKNK